MLKPSLQLKVGQTLTMTPQLQQAIRLLQLPVLDLSAQIKDALEENIMLEAEDLLPHLLIKTTTTNVEFVLLNRKTVLYFLVDMRNIVWVVLKRFENVHHVGQ